jgi:hypothetical protein
MNTSYQRAHGYRTEEVGLRPRGNTVTVDVSSENPFEDDSLAGVSIFTQVSGGMAKPLKDQRSRKIMFSGKPKGMPARNVKALVRARVRAVPVGQMRGDGRFMPGMGDLDGVVKTKVFAVAPRPVRGFIPGMGELDEAGKGRALAAFRKWDAVGKLKLNEPGHITDAAYWNNAQGKRTFWEQDTEKRIADEAKPGFFSNLWGAVKEGTATAVELAKAEAAKRQAGAATAQAQTGATVAKSEAKKEALRLKAAGAGSDADVRRAEIAAGSKTATTKWLVGGGVAVVALGVVAYLLLKPKKA